MEARQRLQDARIAIHQEQQQPQEEEAVPASDGHVDADEGDKVIGTVESQVTTEGSACDGDESQPGTERATDPSNIDCTDATDDMDKKPSATRTIRGKRVRLATLETGSVSSTNNGTLPFSQGVLFPAFYRVVHDAGAAVYNDAQMISFVIRVVPVGVVVLAHEMAWQNCCGKNQMMVRIPDGWVSDDQLERIVAVPLEYQG
jgi:hypothetical protein